MTRIDDILMRMRNNPQNIRFVELAAVCEYYFGEPRQKGTSHHVYKTPWEGDPRVNIQNDKGESKALSSKASIESN